MKKNKLYILGLVLLLCFVLSGCDEAKVNAVINISTETGAGDFGFDIYIRWDDDTKDSLPNGMEGVMNSLKAFCQEKGIEAEFSDIWTETVQLWDDDSDDKMPEDHEASVFNFKFTFDSIDDLNEKIVKLSNHGEVAVSDGFATLKPNPDGTKSFVYRNHALEEVLAAMTTHIKEDGDAYSGDSGIEDMSTTHMFHITIDGEKAERGLAAYSAFPNRTYEVAGSYIDESLIATPTPVPTEALENSDNSKEAEQKNDAVSTDTTPKDSKDEDGNNTIIIVIVVVAVILIAGAAFIVLNKKKGK